MKMRLQVMKDKIVLGLGTYDIVDADSFGKACADAWCKLQQQQFDRESSIGALMDHLDGAVLDQLDGADIHITKV